RRQHTSHCAAAAALRPRGPMTYGSDSDRGRSRPAAPGLSVGRGSSDSALYITPYPLGPPSARWGSRGEIALIWNQPEKGEPIRVRRRRSRAARSRHLSRGVLRNRYVCRTECRWAPLGVKLLQAVPAGTDGAPKALVLALPSSGTIRSRRMKPPTRATSRPPRG